MILVTKTGRFLLFLNCLWLKVGLCQSGIFWSSSKYEMYINSRRWCILVSFCKFGNKVYWLCTSLLAHYSFTIVQCYNMLSPITLQASQIVWYKVLFKRKNNQFIEEKQHFEGSQPVTIDMQLESKSLLPTVFLCCNYMFFFLNKGHDIWLENKFST